MQYESHVLQIWPLGLHQLVGISIHTVFQLACFSDFKMNLFCVILDSFPADFFTSSSILKRILLTILTPDIIFSVSPFYEEKCSLLLFFLVRVCVCVQLSQFCWLPAVFSSGIDCSLPGDITESYSKTFGVCVSSLSSMHCEGFGLS